MEFFNQLINFFVNNPIAIVIIVLAILLDIFYPKFRGYMGEFWVKVELSRLNKNDYKVLNDIMISEDGNTHQIDHIVVSKYGIFVIEMKNYYGMIVGEESKDKWVQYLGKNKYSFHNPIHQNYGHIKTIENLLKVDSSKVYGIVCFSNQAKLKVKTKSPVVQLDNLVKLIRNFKIELLESELVDKYSETIVKNNIVDKKLRKEHVKGIRTKIKDDNQKANNMICPKCGSELVERNGKYGTFIGCSNYPKCKFIKK